MVVTGSAQRRGEEYTGTRSLSSCKTAPESCRQKGSTEQGEDHLFGVDVGGQAIFGHDEGTKILQPKKMGAQHTVCACTFQDHCDCTK